MDVHENERQRVRATHRLPDRYLFYPAQFWPHKNHARIVHALGLLKQEHGLKIFSGVLWFSFWRDRTSTFARSGRSSQLGLEKEIHYLGYVPDEDMSGSIAGACGLVMPTFFGPTNIPVLEAWAFGCPVLTSDIRGIRSRQETRQYLLTPVRRNR